MLLNRKKLSAFQSFFHRWNCLEGSIFFICHLDALFTLCYFLESGSPANHSSSAFLAFFPAFPSLGTSPFLCCHFKKLLLLLHIQNSNLSDTKQQCVCIYIYLSPEIYFQEWLLNCLKSNSSQFTIALKNVWLAGLHGYYFWNILEHNIFDVCLFLWWFFE